MAHFVAHWFLNVFIEALYSRNDGKFLSGKMYGLKGAIVIEFKTVIYSDKKSENM